MIGVALSQAGEHGFTIAGLGCRFANLAHHRLAQRGFALQMGDAECLGGKSLHELKHLFGSRGGGFRAIGGVARKRMLGIAAGDNRLGFASCRAAGNLSAQAAARGLVRGHGCFGRAGNW